MSEYRKFDEICNLNIILSGKNFWWNYTVKTLKVSLDNTFSYTDLPWIDPDPHNFRVNVDRIKKLLIFT
jgi:hypothetical protein